MDGLLKPFTLCFLATLGLMGLAHASAPLDKAIRQLHIETTQLKKESAVAAFELVKAFEKEHPDLSDDHFLEILRIKTKISVRDQFNFNYPKYLRNYLIEAKRLENYRHIYISKRLLFIFHLFNETAKKEWLTEGVSYFSQKQDTGQILMNYSVLYVHFIQQGQLDSGIYYAQKVEQRKDYILRNREYINLLSVPAELYSTYSINDSAYHYHKAFMLQHGFIRHPKDSIYLLKHEMSLALNQGRLEVLPGLLKKAYRLCATESFSDSRSRSLFLTIEKYYHKVDGNQAKELEVSNAYIKLTKALNRQFLMALMDDLMDGELLTDLEVSQERQRAQQRQQLIISIAVLLVLLAIVAIWFTGSNYRKKILKQQLQLSENERTTLTLSLEKKTLEKEKASVEVEKRNQEILYLTSGLKEKSNLLQELNKELKTALVTEQNMESSQHVQGALKKIAHSNSVSRDWENVYYRYKELNPDFFKKVAEIGDKISVGDLKLSALISLNFSNEEIAAILHIEPRSVVIKKHRLKKKLPLEKEDSLHNYLRALS